MTASDTAPPSPGLLDEDVIRVTRALRELAHDHLEPAALETRLAVTTTLRMAMIAIVTAIALVSAGDSSDRERRSAAGADGDLRSQ